MRKLAHIEKVEWIKPIEGADKIELCGVLGWQCVIKKNEFKVGDTIIYVEVDSVMPEKKEFEFLRERKFRVRTIKLRGELSQGLVLPLSSIKRGKYKIGQDVTDELGVKKYLTPSEIAELNEINKSKNLLIRRFKKYKHKSNRFPTWISKTDEERLQNIPQVLVQFKDSICYITEKIDYQSVTFTSKPNNSFIGRLFGKKTEFVVASRNLRVLDKNTLYWKIANKYNIEKILKENPDLTIQGEQGDGGVQGNKYEIEELMFWVFNVINHRTGKHLNYNEMYEFCKKYDLPIVPIVFTGLISSVGDKVEDWVEYSKSKSLINPNVVREGIVVRVIEDGKKLLSFKVINPDFQLKYD